MKHSLAMKRKGGSKIETKVIAGYMLIVVIMAAGLYLIYRNLVEFSDNRLKNEEHRELLLVGNTLSRLYEIESDQNLFTAENARVYFRKYDSIVPEITRCLDSLKHMTEDPLRISRLDSIRLLIDLKRDNLEQVATLLDSMRSAPEVISMRESTYVPRSLNSEITEYLTRKNLNSSVVQKSDTSVVKGQRKGFLDRVRNVFVASEDSTLVIENRSVLSDNQFRVMVDTLINMVRTSEKLNLQRQRQFELAFLRQLEVMSHTNRMLTARIDELLKSVEQEELAKTLYLVMAREKALSGSQQTLFIVSTLAILIALIFVSLFLMDLNKSRRYRMELEQSHKRISDLLSARERLMLTISHDIKAPMSSILGYIELMEQEDAPGKREHFLNQMKHSGDHILRLVSTLLDYHRIESGNWQLKETRFDLHMLTEETAQSFRPLALQKELDYSLENRISEDNIRLGDPYVIRQIMSNLLSNAIKYTQEGQILVKMQEEIREYSDWFIFSVSDTGEGMDEEEQQLVFQEFQRLYKPGKEVEPVEGSGLGLAITKGLVGVLGGKIDLLSEKGKGSTFVVEIPLKTPDALDETEAGEQAATFSRKRMVLVIDDDIVQLMMTSEMLQRIGVDCVTGSDPEKLLSLLRLHSFDLILLDIQMPHTNGLVFAEKIRSSLPENNVPLIALTARSDISADDLREAGFAGYLAKPFTMHELREMLRKHLPDLPVSTDTPSVTMVKGVAALIEFVKEDPVVSKAILQSFIEETSDQIHRMRVMLQENDMHGTAALSHKILPLFRMMDNRAAVSLLRRLEKEKHLSEKERGELMELLVGSVAEAADLVGQLSGSSS